MKNFENFGKFPIVLGVNKVRFQKKFTHVIFSPKRNTKKEVGMIGRCRATAYPTKHIPCAKSLCKKKQKKLRIKLNQE